MFFSIIIPTYNRPERIFDAVKSVLNQTISDFEIIVVNDGSQFSYDKFVEFVKTESRINYLIQENKYLAAARNTGLKAAKGRYICFLDDDDIYLPGHLEALYEAIKKSGYKEALFHTRTLIQYADGTQTPITEVKEQYDSNIDKVLSDRFPTNAVCIHKTIASEFLFDAQLKYAEDLDYWIRVSRKYEIIKVNAYTQILPHETENKMSDFKLPNQYHHLLAFEKFKREYHDVLPQQFLKSKLSVLYRSCADLFAKSGEKKKAFYCLFNWIKLSPMSIFNRQALGIVRLITKLKSNRANNTH